MDAISLKSDLVRRFRGSNFWPYISVFHVIKEEQLRNECKNHEDQFSDEVLVCVRYVTQ